MINLLQSTQIRDYVFPIALARKGADCTCEFIALLGTGFLLSCNRAMTAGHVLHGVSVNEIQVLFSDKRDNSWIGFDIEDVEICPNADAAIFKIKCNVALESFLQLSLKHVHAAYQIQSFGYPNDCLYELPVVHGGKLQPRPDMIYFQGYVKRRISYNPGFPNIKGEGFLEINEWLQPGCSGSPVFEINPISKAWDVLGIYVGDKQVNESPRLGYVLRVDQFHSWAEQVSPGIAQQVPGRRFAALLSP